MRGTRFSKAMIRGAAGLTLVAMSLLAGAGSLSADDGRYARLRIVKDCDTWSNIPGSTFCHITRSNVPELPAGTNIYYDQITAGPTAGPGFLDSNVFVYVNESQWAVGRCTVPNDNGPGLCTLSDGVGALAGLHARIVVTYKPGGSGYVYAWNGTYTFKPIR
jgi:hypothetical protein